MSTAMRYPREGERGANPPGEREVASYSFNARNRRIDWDPMMLGHGGKAGKCASALAADQPYRKPHNQPPKRKQGFRIVVPSDKIAMY